MQCSKIDCENEAKHQLGWRCWAEGYPKTTAPLVAYTGLAVCDECQPGEVVENILTNEDKERIQSILVANKKVMLDFSTAELVFHDIIDGKLQGL